MIKIDKEKCTGCEACANSCLQGALTMKADELTGFLYPNIDYDICTNCNQCSIACPLDDVSADKSFFYKKGTIAYAALNKNQTIRYNSTSGGMFTEFARAIILAGGKVFGAGFDYDMNVLHAEIDCIEDIRSLQRSKYVQSQIRNSLEKIKLYIEQDIPVLFVGAPCQVAGLYSYLGKNYSNLYTVEFICLGVNSPLAYHKWIDECEARHSSKVVDVWFKYKNKGWRNSPFYTRIEFANGEKEIQNELDNYYMKGYLQGSYFVRPSCFRCNFTGTLRCADVTFGDYWGIADDNDDDLGTSVIVVNSNNGQKLFDKITPMINYFSIDYDDVVLNNPRFNTHLEPNPLSSEFFEDLSKFPFSVAIKKYIDNDDSLSDIVTDIIKPRWLDE